MLLLLPFGALFILFLVGTRDGYPDLQRCGAAMPLTRRSQSVVATMTDLQHSSSVASATPVPARAAIGSLVLRHRPWEPTSPHTEMEPLLALTAVHAGLHPTIGPCWALSSGQQPCNRTAGRRLAFALAARAWIPHNSGRAFALVLLAKPGNHGKLDIITEARKYQSRRRRSFDFSSPSQWNRAFAAAVSKSSCSL